MNEIYTDVENYVGLYQVSDQGNVKSLPKGNGNGYRERILRPSKQNQMGHKQVAFSVEGKVTYHGVHRLVAKAFVPNPDSKPYVNHIDHDPTNNAASNLEWCTHKENMQHSERAGRQKLVKELGCKAAKANRDSEALIKFQNLLGSRFIGLEMVKRKRVVTFHCEGCNTIMSARADKAPFRNGNGICNSCSKKMI